MKYTLSFCFIFSISLVFGQENKILLELCSKYSYAEETVLPSSKTVYQYNEQNQEELEEFYAWDNTNRNYKLRAKITSEYDSGQLSSSREEGYYFTNNTISSLTTSDYTYLNNGQPDSTATTYFYNEANPIARKVFHHNENDESKYDSIVVYFWKTSDPRWHNDYKLVYEYLDQQIKIDRLWFDGTA